MGLVALIERGALRFGADRKVIKKDEAYVAADLRRILDIGQQQVADELSRVERLCSQMAADAYREGLQRAQIDATQRWMLAELDRADMLKAMQPALVEVIVDAVGLLVKGIDREAFFARALEQLQGCLHDVSWARLRVHPAASEPARSALAEFARTTGIGRIASVVPDETLAVDACVLESEFGSIDAGLDAQLEAIREAIANVMRGESSASAT